MATFYHGSSKRGLTELVPQANSVRDPAEGPVVFATPDKAIASMFLVPIRQHSGKFNGVPYYVAVQSEFDMRDIGGSLYEVSSEGFSFNPDIGLGNLEWTSGHPVAVIREAQYDSALLLMMESGVQVFLVDRATFDAVDRASDHGYELLKRQISQNAQQGVNFQRL